MIEHPAPYTVYELSPSQNPGEDAGERVGFYRHYSTHARSALEYLANDNRDDDPTETYNCPNSPD